MRLPCRVIQYSDMERCETCMLTWDTNEAYPPECPRAPTDARKGAAYRCIALSLWLYTHGLRALAPPVLSVGRWLFRMGL